MADPTVDIHAEYLKTIAGDDEVLLAMLVQALSKPISKDPRTTPLLPDGRFRRFVDPEAAELITHVRDWLATDLADDAHWLHRTDQHGVPVKLAKLSSLEQASNEADKAMRRRLSRGFAGTPAAAGEGTEITAVLFDGWSVVRLLTPEALDAESHAMQHCIGQGSYDAKLLSGKALFYSLRDPHGSPHATLHLNGADRLLIELSGKQNQDPEARYFRMLRPFLRQSVKMNGWSARKFGIVLDTSGGQHSIDELPEFLSIEGDLDLSDCMGPIPKRIVVSGDLSLPRFVPNGVLDCELRVGEDLRGDGGNLRRFARSVEVGGAFVLTNLSDFEELHPNTQVRNKIALGSLPKFTAFPDDMKFAGTLVVSKSPVTSLPTGFMNLASLRLAECPFEWLPDGLVIRDETHLKRCPIRILPKTVTFGGNVEYSGAMLQHVERNEFDGDLTIVQMKRDEGAPDSISSLPQTLTMESWTQVAGKLTLVDVKMPSGLPHHLEVGGDMDFRGGRLGACGHDIVVGGRAHISTRQIRSLPHDFKVGGDLLVPMGGNLTEVGRNTTVGGNVAIEGDGLLSLPENFVVGGRILMSMSNVKEIGTGFELRELEHAIFSDIAEFPEGMKVHKIDRPYEFKGRLPAGLIVTGKLDLTSFDPDEIPEGLEVWGELKLPEISHSPSF